jgi:hypothetical protein
MSKREKNCRAIAALIVALLTTAFVYTAHLKRQSTKEEFLAYQARRYDTFVQHPSLFRDLTVGISSVAITVILYELVARLLMKLVPDRP